MVSVLLFVKFPKRRVTPACCTDQSNVSAIHLPNDHVDHRKYVAQDENVFPVWTFTLGKQIIWGIGVDREQFPWLFPHTNKSLIMSMVKPSNFRQQFL